LSFVLDASTAMAWLFEDEATAETEAALDRLVEEEALVPPLWPYEVGNVLIAAERRKRISEAQTRQFLGLLQGLPIRVSARGPYQAWNGALVVARSHRLSAYDAAYLDLAMIEGLPLVTMDKALAAAAQEAGVTVG
jgi:predicted nucleic acid-binding protein